MKGILRKTAINAFALFVVSYIVDGFKISGGIQTLILAGLAFGAISLIVKPILTILTLPLNLATFGLFSFVINGFVLYLLTVVIPQIVISAFVFHGASFAGFIIPQISFSLLFAYIVSALVLSLVVSVINWLIK